MSRELPLKEWRLGIDVGQNSVGFGAVEFEDDRPVAILSAVSWIHDGGVDSAEEKTAKSRKFTAGVARRVRRLRRRRRQRLVQLRTLLEGAGIPVPSIDAPQTYEPWFDRELLVRTKIDDPEELKLRLGRALIHMARYRGWRNPWIGINRLMELPVPSESFVNMRDQAALRFGVDPETLSTVGTIGALAARNPGVRLRPKTSIEGSSTRRNAGAAESEWLLFERIRQEDISYELSRICEVQDVDPDLAAQIRGALFQQIRPYVKPESVGHDPFDRSQPRASRGTLEFQEFRIRDRIANLRIVVEGERRSLPIGISNDLAKTLLNYRDDSNPTWLEVMEPFEIDAAALVIEGSGDPATQKAPVDESTRTIYKARRKIPTVMEWWESASAEVRADLVAFLSDTVDGGSQSDEIEELLERLPEDEVAELEKLNFAAGRSAYSRETLRRLNEAMAREGCDLYTARRMEFGVDEYWTPPKATFAEQVGQPTVDRNLALVRRFLLTATDKWGPPTRVVVEHSRDGFMTPQKARELQRDQLRRQAVRDRYRSELRAEGIENPTDRDIRRKRMMQIQNGICTYCGAQLSWEGSEIDHIVPRASGGSNRATNLILACLQCNREKGRRPFGRFAEESRRISLDDALRRVEQWQRIEDELNATQFRSYTRDVKRRMQRVTDDDELDERSMESTAYAARELRERVESFLESQPNYDASDHSLRVHVFNGRVTDLARGVSGIEGAMSLRGGSEKTRMDRRHHAVDALTLTTITPSVARVLIQRDDRKRTDRLAWHPTKSYKEFRGNYGDVVNFGRWLENSAMLAELGRTHIAEDKVPVCRPLRLRPRAGALHLDTVQGLLRKRLGEAFSLDEVRRVAEPFVYEALLEELFREGELADNWNRSVRRGRQLVDSQDMISLFPEKAAMLAAHNGAVMLNYVHHARVYAWRGRKGAIEFGMMRIFTGELGRMGLRKKEIDIFTHPIPIWAESYRLAEPKVLQHIEDGTARQIGWLVDGDEFAFQADVRLPGSGANELFSERFPDRRWTLNGFPSPSRLRLRPTYISAEELPGDLPAEIAGMIEGRGWWPSISIALSQEPMRVMRRTILGSPRWKGASLPISWSPLENARRLLP